MRPASLVPFLAGSALVVLLTWRLVRAERGVPLSRGRPDVPERESSDTPSPASPRRALSMPIAGVDPRTLHRSFTESRGGRPHEALDIAAPRGTPVLAVDDGVVRKLFTSVRGGLTVYQFDGDEQYCYYYAHLDGYAFSLHEGQLLRRGDLIGYVGSTGNARADAPHLHFGVTVLAPDRKWWGGTPIDPYPLLVGPP